MLFQTLALFITMFQSTIELEIKNTDYLVKYDLPWKSSITNVPISGFKKNQEQVLSRYGHQISFIKKYSTYNFHLYCEANQQRIDDLFKSFRDYISTTQIDSVSRGSELI